MRNIFLAILLLLVAFLIVHGNLDITTRQDVTSTVEEYCREICGTIGEGETFFDIFKKYKLNIGELLKLREASANVHRLRALQPGHIYKIVVDENNQIDSFVYCIDDENILNIRRTESGYCAEKARIKYEKRIQHIGGIAKDNLISSIGEGREDLILALQLSDIFAWDIDFTTDLRDGDTFKVVVEGNYLDGEFKKYGNILSAEFINNGETYRAYRFEYDGESDYYGADGKSLKRAFLKAPLSFRRISSWFSKNRFHPILKIYRPHRGLDYTAPAGTPVSAIGDGTVLFSGYKAQYGKLVIIRQPGNWKTYYGHLSKISNVIKRGKKIKQGQIIGYVGSTGFATGPHLHYELRTLNKPINPLTVKLPRGKSVPADLSAEFRSFKNQMDNRFLTITLPYFARAGKNGNNKL